MAGDALSRIALALAAALPCVGCAERDEPGRPAPSCVVLISLDTLRADRLDCYGYERETAPHLSALAREGWRFASVLAQAGQTLASHKSLFHGRYPLDLVAAGGWGTAELLAADDPRQALVEALRRADGGLVDELRRAGWRTAAFTDGGWMRREMGFDRGFEHFDERGGGLAAIVPRVGAWLAAEGHRSTFLFVHAYDVHCPYPTREPFDSRFCPDHDAHVPLEGRCALGDLEEAALGPLDLAAVGDHYDAGIASADAYVGELFALLRAEGAWDEALLVVTSDHGEMLGERGRVGHGALDPEELLVPLFVKFPRSWSVAPRVVEQPLELVDLLPTVLDACGVASHRPYVGRSFLPLLDGATGGRDVLVAQTVFRDPESGVAAPWRRAAVLPAELAWIAGGPDAARGFRRADGRWRRVEDGTPPPRLQERLSEPVAGSDAAAAGRDELPALSPELQDELRSLGYGGER